MMVVLGMQWTTASTLTDSGAAEINLSAAQGSDVYIGIQYYEDGTGGSSGWTLTNVAINSFGDCPVLGTINQTAVCDISLGSADYTCSTNTAGDNNDAVTITIPYTGSESTLVSVTTSTTGTLSWGDEMVWFK